MALIYTATTQSMVASNLKVHWYNIKETCLAPSMASYEAKWQTPVQQRDLYHTWLDAQFIIHPTDFHDLLGSHPLVITSTEAQPSTDFRGWAIEWLARLSKTDNPVEFRYGGELVDGRVNKVIVSGSREPAASIQLMDKAAKTIFPYLKSGYRLVVGDANGVDVTVQMVASEDMKSIMEIWWPGSLGIRYHPLNPGLWIPKSVQHPSDDARIQYIHRTKEMVLSGDPEYNRDVFLAFWDGQSKGTKTAIAQAYKMKYDHGYVFIEVGDEIRQLHITSNELTTWL